MKVQLTRLFPIIILLAGVFAIGCASHKDKTNVRFQPSVSHTLAATPKNALRVAPFQDNRSIRDKTILAKQKNGYGHTTSEVVAAQEPVADVFRNGLIHALEENKFKIAQGSGLYELRGAINSFELNTVTGFWQATGRSKLHVRFDLVNTFTGTTVWQKEYAGAGAISTPWSRNETAVKMFNQSASAAVDQLLADKSFRAYFEGQN